MENWKNVELGDLMLHETLNMSIPIPLIKKPHQLLSLKNKYAELHLVTPTIKPITKG